MKILMNWMEAVIQAGVDRKNSSSLNKKIILSNQISILVFLMAIIYTGLVFVLLPLIWIYPFAAIFLCALSIFMNSIGMHPQGRFLTAITTPFLVYMFHAYLSNPSIGIIDTFYFTMISTMLTGWVLFDTRDKFWFSMTGLCCLVLIVTQNWAIDYFNISFNTAIIVSPYFRIINFGIGGLLFIGILYTASKSKVVYEVENDLLVRELQSQKEEIQAQNEELLQQQEELEAQKEYIQHQSVDIEKKNISLIKSIAAAENIQQTLFCKVDCLEKSPLSSFVFQQSKESVSGVFHWSKAIQDVLFVAVVDSGNAGLAGGFVSLVSHYALNKIDFSTDKNLEELIVEFNTALYTDLFHSKNEDLKGIKFSLLKFDFRLKSLQVASVGGVVLLANQAGVEEIYSSSRIGVQVRLLPQDICFKQYVLSKDITTYIVTAGFMNQIGGVMKNALGLDQLKNKIKEYNQYHIEDQYDKTRSLFRVWQGYDEQTEDVLLMGLKYEE